MREKRMLFFHRTKSTNSNVISSLFAFGEKKNTENNVQLEVKKTMRTKTKNKNTTNSDRKNLKNGFVLRFCENSTKSKYLLWPKWYVFLCYAFGFLFVHAQFRFLHFTDRLTNAEQTNKQTNKQVNQSFKSSTEREKNTNEINDNIC